MEGGGGGGGGGIGGGRQTSVDNVLENAMY